MSELNSGPQLSENERAKETAFDLQESEEVLAWAEQDAWEDSDACP